MKVRRLVKKGIGFKGSKLDKIISISTTEISSANFPDFVQEHFLYIIEHKPKLAGWIASLLKHPETKRLRKQLYRKLKSGNRKGYFLSPSEEFLDQLREYGASNVQQNSLNTLFYGPPSSAEISKYDTAQNAAVISLIVWAVIFRWCNFDLLEKSIQQEIKMYKEIEEISLAPVILSRASRLREFYVDVSNSNSIAVAERSHKGRGELRFFVTSLSCRAKEIFGKRLYCEVARLARILYERDDITEDHVEGIFKKWAKKQKRKPYSPHGSISKTS